MEQGTEEWFAARAGKVTASKLSDVLMKKTTSGYRNYLALLVSERLTGTCGESFTSGPMQWGIDHEPEARNLYQFVRGVTVEEIGFIDHPTIEMTGASPDGLVDEGMVEIKCPNTATHITTLRGGAMDRKYFCQMQWQMACADRPWCDFVSYDPRMPAEMQIHIQRVDRDDVWLGATIPVVMEFLEEVNAVATELINKYLGDGQ
jgi:putative phage-type endonuclease